MTKQEQIIIATLKDAINGNASKYTADEEFTFQKLWVILSNQPHSGEMYDHCKNTLAYIYATNNKLVHQFNEYFNLNYNYQSKTKGNLIHVIKLANQLFQDVKVAKHGRYKSPIETLVDFLEKAEISLSQHQSMTQQEIEDAKQVQPIIDSLFSRLRVDDDQMVVLPSKLIICENYDLSTWRKVETPKMADALEYFKARWRLNA